MAKLSDAPRIPVQQSGRLIPQASTATAFAGIAIVCWLAAAFLGALVITNSELLTASDFRLGSWIDGIGLDDGWFVNVALVWHWTGGPIGSFAIAAIATIWLLAIGRRGWALFVIVNGVGGVLIAEVIKRTVERPRPSWPDPAIIESGGSFPSGHSMAGIYVWAVIGVVLMYLLRRPLGTILGWCLVVFGLLMAPSRLVLGVHWPGDVVAGWLLALGWVLLVTACAVVLVARRSLAETPVPAETEAVSST